ncbi:MAG: hypothetical protein KAR20_23990, partial [Candidatus Heimdallarchaeota archaeon]|nr:hypothetical protein [Candidatus Heimdallarchaeota archaeon]
RVRKSTLRAELPPGLYADPLVPFINPVTGKPIEPRGQVRKGWGEPRIITGYEMYAVPFEVFRGQNQPIWVDVYVPKDASSGVYKGKFKVTADGNISAEIPVTLTVWDFTLPDGPTHRSYFGNFRSIESPSAVSVFSSLYFNVEKDTKRFKEIEMRYCEAMAEHRINPLIPESLLPKVNDNGSLNVIAERHKALKKFIDNLHVTDFCIPHFKLVYTPIFKVEHFQVVKDITTINRDKAVRYYKEFYKYLKENGWEKRAYLYLWDEPNLKENYEQVVEFGELVHDAVPEMRCFAAEQTFSQNPSWPNIDSAVDIWCPLWSYIDRKSINEKIAHGDEVWSYT